MATDAAPAIGGPLTDDPFFIESADGVTLRCALATPRGHPRGTVALFTGRTETLAKYDRLAVELNEAGLALGACEWRGQGGSSRLLDDRRKGHIDDFASYDVDARAFLEALRDRGAPTPWTLLAHSMGGVVGMRALLEDPTPFAAAVFSAPMFEVLLPPALALVAPILARAGASLGWAEVFAPGQTDKSIIEGGFEDNCLTGDPAQFARMAAIQRRWSEHVLGGPTFGWLDAAYRAMGALERDPRVERLTTPITILSAEADSVVGAPAQRRMAARLPNARFVLLEGSRHEPLIERPAVRDQAIGAVLAAAQVDRTLAVAL